MRDAAKAMQPAAQRLASVDLEKAVQDFAKGFQPSAAAAGASA